MPFDIGAGILLTAVVAYVFNTPTDVGLVTAGMLFALLPDIDMLWYLVQKSKHHDHRSYPHYPLLWVPIVVSIYFFFGALWGTLLLLCVAMHLIHDTIGLGWGIAWLWPFSKRKYRFLSPTGNNGSWELFRTWLPEQEHVMAQLQHDPHWVRTYYLQPNVIGFIEYAVLLLGICALSIIFLA